MRVGKPAETGIQIEWVDSDRATQLLGGQCRNVSSSGIGTVMLEPVPLRKRGHGPAARDWRDGPIGLCATACRRGAQYLVGIALTEPLRFTN